MTYDWDFSILLTPTVIGALGTALLTTLELTVLCILFGTPLGVCGGIAALLGRPLGQHNEQVANRLRRATFVIVRGVVMAAIDIVRAIPLLLLILFCYYALPILGSEIARRAGIAHEVHVSAFASVVVAMSVNLAAFVADLVRAAAIAVPRGSLLAARALGMGSAVAWRRIILPHVFREILPGTTLLYISMLKLSTLASVVAVYDLLHTADAIIQSSYRTLEIYCALCVLFVVIVTPLSFAARRLEQAQAFRRRT